MSETETPPKAQGVRARVRAEMTREIKQLARRQLETDGAGQLSLRAIARDLEMASSAIYRYFSSRDELLTALIIDAYAAVADAVEAADATCARDARRERFVAMCLGLRGWAVEHFHEYALIYGSPVPGYEAPDDTIDHAARVSIALLMPVIEHQYGQAESGHKVDPGPASLAAALSGLSAFVDNAVPPSTLSTTVEMWAELFGLINMELFGHFKNTVTDTEAFFAHATEAMADRLFC